MVIKDASSYAVGDYLEGMKEAAKMETRVAVAEEEER
jgi:hypothetical protein